jgi:glycosyltransferase involved in cell wall biosynthesis
MVMKDGKLTFIALVPEAINFQLPKDRGMIPFILKKYFGYDARLVCYGMDNYPYLQYEMKELTLELIPKKTGDMEKDTFNYIIENAKSIDILQFYHVTANNINWINKYKELNPEGKVYIKLDAGLEADYLILDEYLKYTFSLCSLISIEVKYLAEYLTKKWGVKVEYIPNGWYDFESYKQVSYEEKENIICTVGRIGAYEKGSDMLLEAFKLVAEAIPDWSLRLIGPIVPPFDKFIEDYFIKNPELKKRVIFTDYISDRNALAKEYRKAKIFCFPSRFESFGIVLVEASRYGCYIITSSIPAAKDLTKEETYGSIFKIGDTEELARLLKISCSNEILLKENVERSQQFSKENFNWIELCRTIDRVLK